MSYSVFALVVNKVLQVSLLLIAAVVTVYLLSLRTLAKEKPKTEAG
jgi:hypothetical protein